MPKILNLFAKSPFEPLYQHRIFVHKGVNLVKPLIEAIFAGDKAEVSRISGEIIAAEHAADDLKTQIRRHIPRGLFLSVNREDLLRYLKIQDDMIDAAEDIMVLLSIKEPRAPKELQEKILAFVDIAVEACGYSDSATNLLRPLVESAFKGEEVSEVLRLVEKTEAAERKADLAGLELAKMLFSLEDELKASDLIIWFRIFKRINNLADTAAKTGDMLTTLLSR